MVRFNDGAAGAVLEGVTPDPFADLDPIVELEDEIRTLASQIHAATHRLLLLIADFDRRRGWEIGGHRCCADWLSFTTGIDRGAARERVRAARALVGLPQISEAMSRGELSFSQVRALTRVAAPETESELLPLAMETSASRLERVIRGWRRGSARDEARREEELHRSRCAGRGGGGGGRRRRARRGRWRRDHIPPLPLPRRHPRFCGNVPAPLLRCLRGAGGGGRKRRRAHLAPPGADPQRRPEDPGHLSRTASGPGDARSGMPISRVRLRLHRCPPHPALVEQRRDVAGQHPPPLPPPPPPGARRGLEHPPAGPRDPGVRGPTRRRTLRRGVGAGTRGRRDGSAGAETALVAGLTGNAS